MLNDKNTSMKFIMNEPAERALKREIALKAYKSIIKSIDDFEEENENVFIMPPQHVWINNEKFNRDELLECIKLDF